jgi:hypothetical protein
LGLFEVVQPAPVLPPIIAGVNATLAMPTLNASVAVLAIPEPANEPGEVRPWNGLTPAQQAAVAELVEQWRGDDLFLVFDKSLPPLPRKQHIAVQPVRAEAMRPSFAAPANADPVAPCFEGVCGEGLDPSAVFARGGDMAVCDGSWWLSGSGIRKVEEWRAAPLPASPEAQASAL